MLMILLVIAPIANATKLVHVSYVLRNLGYSIYPSLMDSEPDLKAEQPTPMFPKRSSETDQDNTPLMEPSR